MKKIELLAPAKDKETAIAAIDCGADAVYIGASNFGARRAVPNSLDDIKQVVDYAHKFYAKVHVTINTILTDEELSQACELIQNLYEIGVDAIIVQDTGILKLAVDGKLPPISIHASTQCDNRTLEKVKFFENLGVSRVILARELSLEEIAEICANTNVEIETFVHGALCVSYSGQCYMSHAIGGRSANRGECAQACRKKYSLVDAEGNIIAKDKYLLSLRDFNASRHLEKLIKAGVKSFKIEGRLKDINYVKNVVAFYRREIDKYAEKISSGRVELDFEPDVNKTFNRGYTDYFLDGRKKCFNFETPKSMGEKLGKVTKVNRDNFELEDIAKSDYSGCEESVVSPHHTGWVRSAHTAPYRKSAQDGLCWFADGEIQGCLVNRVEGKKIFPNKMPPIKIGTLVYRNQDVEFEKQLKNSKTKRRIAVDFTFDSGNLTAKDEDGNETSLSVDANEAPKNPDKMCETFINQLQKTGESDFYCKSVELNSELPFLPISAVNELRREILAKLTDERLKNYRRELQKPLCYADFPKKELDYLSNIHNNSAKNFYENCGCEVCEMSLESGTSARSKCLMQTKHCLKYAFNMCKSPKKLFLIDEKGKKYPLKFDCKNCTMLIYD